jgi:hypothetical protein
MSVNAETNVPGDPLQRDCLDISDDDFTNVCSSEKCAYMRSLRLLALSG